MISKIKSSCIITIDSFFLEPPKEKGTLELPIEEIEISRIPPKYVTPMRFITVKDPNQPTLIFDLDGVFCRCFSMKHRESVPDLEATYFNLLEERGGSERYISFPFGCLVVP